jgi:Cof subfamily protein (haloacid dehalogenase superfamily)
MYSTTAARFKIHLFGRHMIRCIAMDLDDTLLNDSLEVSEDNKAAIKKAAAKGIKVLLASGRMVRSMRFYSSMLNLDIPLIAYNGAVIQESMSDKILYSNPVPMKEAVKVISVFKERNIHLNIYLNDELYMDKLTSFGDKYSKDVRVQAHIVDDIAGVMKVDPYKMLGIGKVSEIEEIQSYLKGQKEINLDFIRSKPHYLEILAPDVSKADALKKLTTMWNIESDEVMAIGDAPNDISMMEWAGIGVAVGNATDHVKQKADMVVSDNNNSGVAEAIYKVL